MSSGFYRKISGASSAGSFLCANFKHIGIPPNYTALVACAAGEGVVKSAPATIKFPDADVTFKLESSQLAMIQRTSSVLKASDVSIVGVDGNLKVIVSDKKNDTSNAYEMTLGTTDETFKANIKVENLKMLPNDYDVSLSKKKISRFKHTASDLTYYVAVEADSEF